MKNVHGLINIAGKPKKKVLKIRGFNCVMFLCTGKEDFNFNLQANDLREIETSAIVLQVNVYILN